MTYRILVVIGLVILNGCSTFVTPRYSISADTNVALKALNSTNIAVGNFVGPSSFDNACRAAGPLAPPDNLSHTEYVKKAFEDELKVAGVFTQGQPRVTLSGNVTKLEFSSSRGLTGGSWAIDLTLTSSNGQSMTTSEYYEFQSGFIADTACKQTAEAYMPAVQNLIGKVVRSPQFKGLVQ
jgi:hypothetical protein